MDRRSLRSRFVSLMFRLPRPNGLPKNSSGLGLKGAAYSRTAHENEPFMARLKAVPSHS